MKDVSALLDEVPKIRDTRSYLLEEREVTVKVSSKSWESVIVSGVRRVGDVVGGGWWSCERRRARWAGDTPWDRSRDMGTSVIVFWWLTSALGSRQKEDFCRGSSNERQGSCKCGR